MLIKEMLLKNNFTPGRVGGKVDTITIHHMAGRMSLEACKEHFDKPGTRASSNYAIDAQGNCACYVKFENTSWCSSSTANDRRAVTIELANDSVGGEWHVSHETIHALIHLLVEVCQKAGIPALRYTGKKEDAYTAKCNVTLHEWFKNKVCPGPYIKDNLKNICVDVNRLMGVTPAKQGNLRDSVRVDIPGLCCEDARKRILAAVTAAGYSLIENVRYGIPEYFVGAFKTAATGKRLLAKIQKIDPDISGYITLHPTRGC